MIQRAMTGLLQRRLGELPAVALLGPRQCGKSTLAKALIAKTERSLYLDLERPSDLRKLGEAEAYLERYSGVMVCLDEVQRVPDLFATLRSLIDDDRRPGRFFLLGSASRDLIRQSSESLAGRVGFLELTPLLVDEVGSGEWDRLWVRGGFPDSFLARSDEASFDWRHDFISSFLERDLPQLGFNYPSENLRRFWTMCAHMHGQTFNASQLGSSLGVSHHTARSYAEALSQCFALRLLRPFAANVKKRLVKTPKLYVRDTGALHALLAIEDLDALFGHPVMGASWEGFIVESILPRVKPAVEAYYYRSAGGDEIDLVLSKGETRVAIECKASKAPRLSEGSKRAMEVVRAERAYVAAPVSEQYPVGDGWTALPVGQLLHELRELGFLAY